jgi:hypothetical protein
MLRAESAGQRYVKADHRRALLSRLDPVRTAGAVEYKHQNISAAMLDLGLPWIRGYQPVSNDQDALADEIQRQLEADPHLLQGLRAGTGQDTPPARGDDPAPGTGRLQRTPVPAPSVWPARPPVRPAVPDASRTTGSCTRKTPAGAGAARNWWSATNAAG